MKRKLKCYLSEAITLLRQEEKKEFIKIYDFIEDYLITEHEIEVFNPIKHSSDLTDVEIYKRDLKEINKADFIVAEVSVVSWGVGEEIIYAIMKGKPILALYNKDSTYKLSEMVSGSRLRLRIYHGRNKKKWKQEIIHHITEFITELKQYLYLRRKLCAPIP